MSPEFELLVDEARVAPPEAAHAPFALTDMQHAYWVGEQKLYRLQTPALLYRSFDSATLDLMQLEAALIAVVTRHPALRTRVLADGRQQVEPPPLRIEIALSDISGTADRADSLTEHHPEADGKLPFSCWVERLKDGYVIHFIVRLIALDGRSIMMFFDEVAAAYLGAPLPPAPAASYRDFVLHQQQLKEQASYQRSLEYWRQRIAVLPSSPELPLVEHDAIPMCSTFLRKQIVLEAEQVEQLKLRARKCGVTLNALLCTTYADVLRLWSRNVDFTLNLLVSQHASSGPEFEGVLGNFSNTLLLEVAATSGSLRQRAQALQQQLYRELEHAQVSGVEVIRAMRRGGGNVPAMPVVFASTLGLVGDHRPAGHCAIGWRVREGRLHTPQVWLDHQVYMDEGRLVLNWDFAEQVFLPEVPEQMFAVYQHQLDALLRTTDAADQSFLPRVPQRFLEARLAANDTDIPLPGGLLHDLFAMACREHASRPALLSEQRNLSYDQLWCFSTRLAEQLRGHGVGVNDVVAVLAHRGWRQITAVLAVLQAGGAYLPVDANTPPARREHLIEQPGVKLLLTERALLADMKLPPDVLPLVLEDVLDDGEPGPAVELASAQLPEDLAYVIFTSGSTGRPKGVAISHRGAVNTVQDVIARFGLGASDRVLGVSALNFDLSVYDIFGTLSCGAALVLPAPSAIPAPDQWGSCVQDYGVTVWNSVPALLDMQLEYSGTRAAAELATLRLVMLSGDWIPVALPERLAAQVPRALLVSLGGATEASIWSNYFVVRKVDPAWTSIPYGWPLSNQRYHVLNAALQPVPTWVAGHLYIAGSGLAQGYYLDAVRTSASFIYHPTSGERLYRTGDVGRYHPSGYLEFLGRNDNQVKIRGFRIEIGEIESALERCAGVRNAAVVVREVGQRDRQLLGFYVAHSVGDIALTPETVRRELAESMPDYMVPPVLVELERLPVSSNGKLDRAALAIVARHHQLARAVRVAPRNATEQGLAALWQKLLEGEEPGVHDNFFELGGTSLLAVRLLHMIAEKFDRQLALASLLRHGTIAAQAELLQQERSPVTRARRSALVMLQEGASDGPLLLAPHPVGGNVLCYRALAALVPAGVTVAGLQSPGDGSARTVDGMADDYLRQVAPLLRQRRALYLLGWSMGGVIASQMAHQMEAAGNRVNALVMIDSWSGATDAPADATLTGAALLHSFVSDLLAGDGVQNWQAWHELSEDECIDAAMEVLRTQGAAAGQLPRPLFLALLAEHAANYNALIRHRPALLSVPTRQYRASRTQAFPLLEPVVQGRVTHLERDHFTIIDEAELARIVAAMFAPTM